MALTWAIFYSQLSLFSARVALTKEQKGSILHSLTEAARRARSIVFVHFKGLNVASTTEMRRALLNDTVSYVVAKKTLMKKALADKGVTGSLPDLTGEVAWAYGDDLVAPARVVYEFQKKFPENLEILGGVFDGRYMTQSEMVAIASIPPLPVLHGKFVNIINSPIQRFVIGLQAIADKKSA